MSKRRIISWIGLGVPASVIIATLIGTPHTISDAILYIKIGLNLIVGLLIWGLLFGIFKIVNHILPSGSVTSSKRWFLLLLISLPLTIATVWGAVYLRNYFINEPFSNHIFIYTDIPVIALITVGILILYQKLSTTSPARLTASSTDSITVKNHLKTHLIPIAEIAYIYRVAGVNYVRKMSGENILSDKSIKGHEGLLDPFDFFRINRQLLVNRKAISSFRVSPDRKTILVLNPEWTESVILDKNRMSLFKKWILLG